MTVVYPVVPAAVVGRIAYCLITALEYLYEGHFDERIYHFDVKPANILYTKNSSVFKLTDFNISSKQLSRKLDRLVKR